MTDTTLGDLRAALGTVFTDGEIEVALDGDRAHISVVSDAFAGLSRVKQQQAVYAAIGDFVSDGRLHAVTIDTRTKDA